MQKRLSSNEEGFFFFPRPIFFLQKNFKKNKKTLTPNSLHDKIKPR